MTKVSVIIPVYNTGKWLKDCLESVRNQTLTDIEIICVNDASTDKSLSILKNFAEMDSRILIINSVINQGVSVSRNMGVAKACGQFLYFLDSDDMIEKSTLEKLYQISMDNNLDACVFDAKVICDNIAQKEVLKVYDYERRWFKRKNFYEGVKSGLELYCEMFSNGDYKSVVWEFFINRDFYMNSGLCFYPGIVHEDELFTFSLFMKAKRVSYVNDELYIRRVRCDSIMTSQKLFRHSYGSFICVIEMLKLRNMIHSLNDDTTKSLIVSNVDKLLSHSRKIYKMLDVDEQLKYNELDVYERFLYEKLIVELCDLQKPNLLIEKEKRSIMAERDRLKKSLNSLKNGWSFKIGRVITFVPRKFRSGIKCYRKNGFKYTIRSCKEKFLGLFDNLT